MNLLKQPVANMRVNLSCLAALMPMQLLNDPQTLTPCADAGVSIFESGQDRCLAQAGAAHSCPSAKEAQLSC